MGTFYVGGWIMKNVNKRETPVLVLGTGTVVDKMLNSFLCIGIPWFFDNYTVGTGKKISAQEEISQ